MAWFDKNEKKSETEKKDDEIELKPSEVKAKLDQIDGIATKIKDIDEIKKTTERMNSFLDEQAEAKRKKTAEEAAARATQESTETDETWLTDPKKAFQKEVQPLTAAVIRTNSRLLRKELFDDNPGEYEFYTGEFKTLVDQYIDKLPLNSQNDPASLKNCYNVVLGQKHREITEGKVKSKFSAQSTASGRSGTTDDKDKLPDLTDTQKKVAKGFEMTEAEYAKSLKEELNYV